MAEPAAGNGRALRVYQILLVLAAGWAIGRVPDLFRSNAAEEAVLRNALAGAPAETAARAMAGLSEERVIEIASQVAAQVAASAANETVTRLIAAGWGPGSTTAAPPPPQTIIIREPSGQAPVIRVVNEAPAWSLPPGRAADTASLGAPATAGAAPATGRAVASAPPAARTAASPKAYALATRGYDALKAGDRKAGVGYLSAAIAADPDAPQATAWTADVRRLTQRWSAEIYTLGRGAGNSDPLAASPVLGGSQSGLAIAYTVNPLGRRPVSVVARVTSAGDAGGSLDPETTEGAIGLRVRPVAAVPVNLDVERRFAIGPLARSTWATRISGGGVVPVELARVKGGIELYGEGGVVGFVRPDFYIGAQARAGTPLYTAGRVRVDAGAGLWGGWQESGLVAAGRMDAGPSMRLKLDPWPFSAQVDYRLRTLGNADPGSGPVITIAGQF